jgi:hypothetical protein
VSGVAVGRDDGCIRFPSDGSEEWCDAADAGQELRMAPYGRGDESGSRLRSVTAGVPVSSCATTTARSTARRGSWSV